MNKIGNENVVNEGKECEHCSRQTAYSAETQRNIQRDDKGTDHHGNDALDEEAFTDGGLNTIGGDKLNGIVAGFRVSPFSERTSDKAAWLSSEKGTVRFGRIGGNHGNGFSFASTVTVTSNRAHPQKRF